MTATVGATGHYDNMAAGSGGYALYFDGNDFVDLGPDVRLNPTKEYTIELWVAQYGGNWRTIFSRYNGKIKGSYIISTQAGKYVYKSESPFREIFCKSLYRFR